MTNIGYTEASKRVILYGMVDSQMLYGTPERKLAMRICSTYKTISRDAICVIAEIHPIGLQLVEKREKHIGVGKVAVKENTLRSWRLKWTSGCQGRGTYRPIIFNIERWICRTPYYDLFQALSALGRLGK